MAIQFEYTDRSGLQLARAYLRCLQVNVGVGNGTAAAPEFAHLEFGVYVDAAARQRGAAPLRVLQFNLPDDDENDPGDYFGDMVLAAKGGTVFEGAYVYAKALPEFARGIDV